MLISGRQEYFASSVVRNAPQLPGLGKGQLQLSHSLEQPPTASVQIVGIPQRELARIRSAYTLGTQYRFYGEDYEVVSYEDTRQGFPCPTRQKYGVEQEYEINVQMEGNNSYRFNRNVKRKPLTRQRIGNDQQGIISAYAVASSAGISYSGPFLDVITELKPDKYATISPSEVLPEAARMGGGFLHFSGSGVSVKYLGSGRTWNFTEKQVLDDGAETEEFRPAFSNVEVTGDFSNNNEDDEAPDEVPDFVSEEPVTLELISQDDLPFEPPADTVLLRDISSNADQSGPTKQWSRTLTINGATVLEEKQIYGFAYTGQDIHKAKGLMFSKEPKNFWQVIDYQKTVYEYEEIGSVSISINVQDTVTGENISVLLDPDAPGGGSVSVSGNTVTVNSGAEYLVKEVTTGFQLVRFQQEPLESDIPQTIWYDLEPDRYDDPVEKEKYKLWQFFKNPLYGERNYELRSERSHYVEGIADPVSVNVTETKSLDPKKAAKLPTIAKNFGTDEVRDNYQIALAQPSPNYVESMLVFAEGENQHSYRYTPHPENTPEDALKPPFIVGKEVLNRTFRSVLIPSAGRELPEGQAEKYEERTKEYTAQDPGYDSSLEIYRTKEVSGRPPQATTRTYTFKQEEVQKTIPGQKKDAYRYFLSSNTPSHSRVEYGGSKSYPNATSLSQAVRAAKVDLELQDINARTSSKSFTWSYPEVTVGDMCVLRNKRYFITSVSTTYEYEGSNNPLAKGGKPLTVCRQGLQLEMGLYSGRSVFSRTERDDRADDQQPVGSGDTELTSSGGTLGGLGEVSVDLQTRRSRV